MKKALIIFFSLVITLSLFALEVSGEQYGLWSLDNSPYLLTGDVEVPEGTMLVIEPGVTVRAMGDFRLNVEGEIQAVGTEADSIRFENGQDPLTNTWKGVRFENSFLQSNFKHCIFEYADYGLNSVDSPAEISYCRFSYNTRGIHLFGIGSDDPAVVNVHNNIIEHSVQNGIIIPQNSNAWIHHNEVRYNGTSPQYYGAIQLSNQSAGGQNNPIIEHNYVHNNFKQGITAWDIVGANAINATIRYNHIESNLTGIYLLNASGVVHDNIIINNFIPGDANSGAGMMIGGATSAPHIAGNVLTGNFTAFYLAQNSVPILGDISSDHPFAYGENIIQNNIDESGTLHAIACASYTAGDNIIMAQNNDWGAYTADEIMIGIMDHSVNPSFPTVIFEPWWEPLPATTISGTFGWDGNDYDSILPEELKIQLVTVEDGLVLDEYELENNPFSFETEIDEPFYVLLCAIEPDDEIWAGVGGLDDLTIFEPAFGETIELDEIYIQKDMHYVREITGAPFNDPQSDLIAVSTSFLVYQPHDIKLFDEDGHERYLVRQYILMDGEYVSHHFQDYTLFYKTGDFEHGEIWQQSFYEGTQLINREVQTFIDEADNPSFVYTIDESMAAQEFIDQDEHRLYLYDAEHYAENYLEIVQYSSSERRFYKRDNVDHPSNFRYRILLEMDEEDYGMQARDILFWWQAPARSQSLDYEGYNLLATSPHWSIPTHDQDIAFDLNCVETRLISEGTTTISLTAFAGDEHSDPANTIILEYTVSNEDLVQKPEIRLYPNPVNFAGGEALKIESKELAQAKMKVYNLRGQLVFSDIISDENYAWNGINKQGKSLGSGVYMLRIETKDGTKHQRKILIMK